MKNCEILLHSKSIVVIGASEQEGKVGNILLKNLSSVSQLFGVNIKGGIYNGIEFVRAVEELPLVPDLAIVAIPARFVLETLKQCGVFGIKNIVIISAGFKEIGNVMQENELVACAKQYNMNILGPNCLGFLNMHSEINASFTSAKNIEKGNVALVSQSGAMAVAMMDFASEANIGFSKIISMGNKCDMNENDFLDYLATDSETDVIVLYLESIVDGRKFFEIASRVSKIKPIIMVKSGISAKGSQAAQSHTGALAGKKEILEAALSQAGVHSTHSLEEMFLLAKMFSHCSKNNYESLPKEVVIITNAGGPAVMAVDNAEIFSLSLASFSAQEEKNLLSSLPLAASGKNPIDILGDAKSDRYEAVLENIKKYEEKNDKSFVYCILLTKQSMTDADEVAKKLIAFQKNNPQKMVIASFMGGENVASARELLQDGGILHFEYPRNAFSAYTHALEQQKRGELEEKKELVKGGEDVKKLKKLKKEEKEEIRNAIEQEKKVGKKMCSPALVSRLFSDYTLPFLEEVLCTSKNKIVKKWEKISKESPKASVVLKVSSSSIMHKTDIGGVFLNLSSRKEVEKAYDEICENTKGYEIDGVTIQEMVQFSSREIYVGFLRDITFGDVIILGYGGIYLNIFSDISRRVLPVSHSEIEKMLQETKFYALLLGARGENPINMNELINTIYKLSQMFMENREIASMDINPILAWGDKIKIVDAKIFI